MVRSDLALDALRRIRQRMVERAGIEIPDERLAELDGVVEARAHVAGEARARYAARLAAFPGDPAEIERLAAHLAVRETFFFRGMGQLDLVVDRALDEIAAARPGRPIRVLSAGAASGAEAYSIAVLVRERRPELAGLVRITGIDLSPAAVAAARRGRYHAWALRQTPAEVVARWFRRQGAGYEIDPRIRAMATFEVRNLLALDDAFWSRGAFDVILCRHVLMYFAEAPAQAVFSRLERSLSEPGYLFLAPDDMLRRFVADRALCRREGVSYYHGRRAPERPAAAEPRRTEARSPAPIVRASPSPVPAGTAALSGAVAAVDRGSAVHAAHARTEAAGGDPPDAVGSYLLALCSERAGDLDGARRHATAAAYLDPTFAMPCVHLAVLAQRACDLRAARREFTRAIALLAAEDEARISLFGGGLGRDDLIRVCRRGLSAVEEAR